MIKAEDLQHKCFTREKSERGKIDKKIYEKKKSEIRQQWDKYDNVSILKRPKVTINDLFDK